ncbi:sugar (Glycoside-Pentoside-Hexuronide) transporter domain protein [Sphingomonas sp. S17]|uniref:MFS transporter n=2 Tax=Sphingomonas paucimobilis TaxID=13689 RepID=A0A7T3ACJ5_SPHPI|nr:MULTISPECIES: MFS transporter [Sphingomonas]EGI56598.1 sugar (Glycoside-Pentoside-Hexuronide) transporter domain protein [Sphingomonas sp. S17]MBQ1479104.1 MFS transporter [Sphingomonas sp.]MCM3678596.1 MFS transporter [Sphingomonas paucimobilis]QPS17511.1 MFS transporter [Sphingomonas paucimobilis]QPT09039.1 MFS transporter [Sphingomonas paucimobilis]
MAAIAAQAPPGAGEEDRIGTADPHIPFFEKICYGLGDAGGTIVTGLIANFLTFYYTDVFGLAPGIVGILFLSLRIFDAISDPLIGIMADRTSTRWGRFRPYLLWTAIPVGLSCFLTFQSPDLGYDGKVAYAAITYFLLAFSYSLNNVPYCALITRMTDSAREGVSCQSVRFAMVAIASFCVSVGLPIMVRELGGADIARGYRDGVAILCLAAVAMFLICFLFVRERVVAADADNVPLKVAIATTLKNDQLRLTFIMTLLLIGIFNTKGGAALYFITYVLGGDTTYQALFFGTATAGGFLGSVIVPFFTRRFDVKTVYVAVNLILVAGHFAAFFVPGGYPMLWLVLVALCCIVLGCTLPLHFTLIQLADQYGEWKLGMRSSGMSFAFNQFFVKLAWALAGVLISGVLVIVSYKAGMENQTPTSLTGIRALSTIIPGLMHLALAATAARLILNRATIDRMTAERGQ